MKLAVFPGDTGSYVIKICSCSTELGITLILLINFEMATIVGILTLMRRIRITSRPDDTAELFVFPDGTDNTAGEYETENFQGEDATGYPYHYSYTVVEPVFNRCPTRL